MTATSLVDSFADRDAFVAGGMETGIREGYQRLDELLARWTESVSLAQGEGGPQEPTM